MQTTQAASKSQPIKVSQLALFVKNLLEQSFPEVWVTGEISNLSQPSSGHVYFTLKDESAQIKCAFFKPKALRFYNHLANGNGLQVNLRVKVSLYPERGDFQLIVEELCPAGEGSLMLLYQALVQKLQQVGLFDLARKRSLPKHPSRVGIISSPTGAAVMDILSVLKRRCPSLEVYIYPSKVQGQDAPDELIRALALANQDARVDVLILTRGGGSLEDLWAFNNEELAFAIANSKLPVISAVGHEVDTTISDMVADLRAATPSAAAEMVSVDLFQLYEIMLYKCKTLKLLAQQCLEKKSKHLALLAQSLQHPQEKLALKKQILAEQQHRLIQVIENQLTAWKDKISRAASLLQALSPLEVLARGYSLVKDIENHKIITSSNQVSADQTLFIQLSQGEIVCRVQTIRS
ncbi:MAG: exodeoxyribonuclease VII large subunit [Gammaproteobacteria bacterium]